MQFSKTPSSLTELARTAVLAKADMTQAHTRQINRDLATYYLESRYAGTGLEPGTEAIEHLLGQIGAAWQHGTPYLIAPAMTAVVAAAAEALDLTGDTLTGHTAPGDLGTLFLPEPLYVRRVDGSVHSLAAITWARVGIDGNAVWAIFGWADRFDARDPQNTRLKATFRKQPKRLAQLGRYILVDHALVPIGTPIRGRSEQPHRDGTHEWEAAPDGRFVIQDAGSRHGICLSVAYAFWRIQEQPLATIARPPADKATRRRAERDSITHDTRVVMLRRSSSTTTHGGEPKWRYQVRFVVRGHWRRLTNRDGEPYRTWVNAHIKGPEDRPLLGGEKVNILSR
ncbi:hypothetical protein [Longispora albida]|uniref:hypothetical protein n=1 Tax=Longispora albida TaxID=203523 RepID=UPI00036518D2|nr:hypothetical protein [Longispora albida]